jgi:putative phosphoribosyl transferase
MFANRRSAGRQLSARLQHLREEKPVVLALPSGGVPVGFEIAQGLDAPLDIVLVRKIGVPWQPELALGAVVNGANPQTIINRNLAAELAIDEDYIRSETERQLQEIERRKKVYLGNRRPVPLVGRTVIVVDDGIATGSTARTALRAIRNAGAGKIVLAVPVAPKDALDELQTEVDEIICLSTPNPFLAVGVHYAEFGQLVDADVISLLKERQQAVARAESRSDG